MMYSDITPYLVPRSGLKTPYGHLFPPGGRVVARVRATAREGDDAYQDIMVKTLAAGLARCKSGYGDVVLVEEGHAESDADLTNLVPGTTIIGLGDPRQDSAPTFTWATTTTNWAVNDKNVTIAGLRLVLGGADGVTTGITFSAAGCRFIGNHMVAATSAALECTTCLSVSAGATDLLIAKNTARGAVGATTSVVAVAGAADSVEIVDNDFVVLGSAAATGVIHVSAAATNLRILGNKLTNSKSDSTAAISVATATAATGIFADNDSVIFADGVAASTGILFAGSPSATIRCFRNQTCDEPRVSGVLSPAGCAT
jgi:hypothetical protein